MKGIELRLPSEVTNTTLPRLGEYAIGLIGCGDLSDTTKIALSVNSDNAIRIEGGHFVPSHEDVSNVGTIRALAYGINDFYIKLTESTGRLIIEKGDNLVGFGEEGALFASCQSEVNSPIPIINLDDLPINLASINNSWAVIRGNIRELTKCKRLVYVNCQKEYVGIQKAWLDTNPALENEWVTGSLPNYGQPGHVERIWPELTRFNWQVRGSFSISLDAFLGCTKLDTLQFYNSPFGTRTPSIRIEGGVDSLRECQILQFLTVDYAGIIDAITGWTFVLGNIQTLFGITLPFNTLISGTIDGLPVNAQHILLPANSVITGYASRTFIQQANILLQSVNLTTAELDALLIDTSKAIWVHPAVLALKGTRSSASDAAVAALKAKPVSVYVNGVLL